MDYIYDVERLWDQTGETRVLKKGGRGGGGVVGGGYFKSSLCIG